MEECCWRASEAALRQGARERGKREDSSSEKGRLHEPASASDLAAGAEAVRHQPETP